jgi:hypothetical protein
MRVSYSISYDTFVALQPPFRTNEPLGRSLFFFIYIATICSGVGFVLLSLHIFFLLGQSPPPGTSLLRAIEIFGFSVLSMLGAWSARWISSRQSRNQHVAFLRDSYARLHCREQRFVETTDDGLLIGCDCGTVTRPWAQLWTLAETDRVFVLCTSAEVLAIPKTSFSSGGDQTEFRAILSQRLSQNKSVTARAVEFACNPGDWRSASWLQFKVGGSLRAAGFMVLALVMGTFILLFVPFFDPDVRMSRPLVVGACIFVLLLLILAFALRRRTLRHWVPMKVWIAEDAMYVQYPVGECRIPWTQVTRCIADKKSLLFVQSDNSVILIPQRCIPPAQREYVQALLHTKVEHRAF